MFADQENSFQNPVLSLQLDYQDESRVGTGSAGLALTALSLTLPGAAVLYYGQELGLQDGPNNTSLDPAAAYVSVVSFGGQSNVPDENEGL